jgi:hypothetical protein
VDVTSYSDVNDYLPYRVPEVWLFKNSHLLIYGLQPDRPQADMSFCYTAQTSSRHFPNIDVNQVVSERFQVAGERNISTAIRALRRKLANEN